MALQESPERRSVSGRQFLVTGSAGFIGSTLATDLLSKGAGVVGVDSFTDSYDPAEKRSRMQRLASYADYRHVAGDLTEIDLRSALSGVDTVYHLAGRPGVRDSFDLYPLYAHDNIEATAALVAAAEAAPSVRRLVFASSSSVYGNAELPLRETQEARPISPYGQTKLEAERICLDSSGTNLETVALRFFTVYGPEQRPDMAFRRFIEATLEGRPIPVYGDGLQTRDFTFVGDIVTATELAGAATASGVAINIGGGSQVTIQDVLRTISDLTGHPLNVRNLPAARGDVRHTFADLARAWAYLGFRPSTTLRRGLAAEVGWLRGRVGPYKAERK